jgi:hypothetical protein
MKSWNYFMNVPDEECGESYAPSGLVILEEFVTKVAKMH